MKQILVPTDFSVQSLRVIHEIVKRNKQEAVHIHLIHMVQVPSDISELMYFRKSRLFKHVPADFKEAIQLLTNKYKSSIQRLTLDFYYGNYSGVLNAVVENLKIDEIHVLDNYPYTLPLTNSVNVISFLSKCSVPVYKCRDYNKTTQPFETRLLSSLFVNEADFLLVK